MAINPLTIAKILGTVFCSLLKRRYTNWFPNFDQLCCLHNKNNKRKSLKNVGKRFMWAISKIKNTDFQIGSVTGKSARHRAFNLICGALDCQDSWLFFDPPAALSSGVGTVAASPSPSLLNRRIGSNFGPQRGPGLFDDHIPPEQMMRRLPYGEHVWAMPWQVCHTVNKNVPGPGRKQTVLFA